jgi:hypothetical protein
MPNLIIKLIISIYEILRFQFSSQQNNDVLVKCHVFLKIQFNIIQKLFDLFIQPVIKIYQFIDMFRPLLPQ